MAIKIRSILKNWFQNGKKPPQEQFWDWMDSFWHKTEDKIPITNVENLATTLNSKANQVALDAETTARQDGDAGLQEQISNLQKITTIRGNVDTHADLLAIDTETMRSGDSYIVEADETRENKATIYAFDADNSAWIYTGEWAGGDLSEYQKIDEKGVAGGYAPLWWDNKIQKKHLPPCDNMANTDLVLTGARTHSKNGHPFKIGDRHGSVLELDSTFGSWKKHGSLYYSHYDADGLYYLNRIEVNDSSCVITSEKMGGATGYGTIITVTPDKITATLATVKDKFTYINGAGELEYLPAADIKQKLAITATDVAAEPAFIKNTAFNKDFGTVAGTVAQGSDLVNADWNATSGLAEILNKPGLLSQQDIDDSIDAIKIGGVNLLLNSNKPLPTGSASGVVASVENDMLKVIASAGNENYQGFKTGSLNIDDLKDGDLITLSYWAYSPDSTQIPSLYVNSSMGYHNMNGIMSDKISVFTATVPYKSDFEIRLHLGFGGRIGTFYFKYFKIEKGNKATDWSPSYNDIKIGATNLLPNTNQGITGWSRNTANGVTNFSEVLEIGVRAVKATTTVVSTTHHVLLYNLNRMLLKNSTEYTLSVDVLCEFNTSADFRLADADASNLLVNFGAKAIAANTWTHVELTATSNSNAGTNQLLYIRGFNTLGSVTFANLKIETGNKRTDWSPSFNDYLSLSGGTVTGIVQVNAATKPTATAYSTAGISNVVTAAEHAAGNKPGLALHAANNFGMFMYAEDANTLKKVNSSGSTTTFWDSGNLYYEEGVWTPAIAGVKFTIIDGIYKRIGNTVLINAVINKMEFTGSPDLIFTGLPFTATATTYLQTQFYRPVVLSHFAPVVVKNSNVLRVLVFDNSAAGYRNVRKDDLKSDAAIYITGTYNI